MNLSHLSTSQLRELLRYLIIVQLVGFAVSIGADFVFPPPEEITAALEIIAEDESYEPNFLHGLLVVGVGFLALGLTVFSFWQLYRFDRRGVSIFVVANVLIMGAFLLSPAIWGGWTTPQASALGIVPGLCAGVMLAICVFKPEIFEAGNTVSVGKVRPSLDQSPSVSVAGSKS